MIWLKTKIDSCANMVSCTYNEKAPLGMLNLLRSQRGNDGVWKSVHSDQGYFVFTYNYDDNFYIILFRG